MEQDSDKRSGVEARQRYRRQLLTDLHALERMVGRGDLETEGRRLSVSQEVGLVDHGWQPATVARRVVDRLDPARFAAAAAAFNIELRLDPFDASAGCLQEVEELLLSSLVEMQAAANREGARVMLSGILPTLERAHLDPENLVLSPRVEALREAIDEIGGTEVDLAIGGRDELIVRQHRLMLESANAGFRIVHQVPGSEFARQYNLAQLMIAPVLAAAVNSPLVLGKQLWRESRIALFGPAGDSRRLEREQVPRVYFGSRWVDESVIEIFREDIARFPILVDEGQSEDALGELRDGRMPRLAALDRHNATIQRWLRPCYRTADGKPSLGIENRALPAGPTVLDEVANAALWLGLVTAGLGRYGDVRSTLPFSDARGNFFAAARYGLDANLSWPGMSAVSARELILSELLPLALDGLEELGIEAGESDRYSSVIEERVRTGRTGAWWLADGDDRLRDCSGTAAERAAALAAGAFEYQSSGRQVHEWGPLDAVQPCRHPEHYRRVGQLMSRDLFTVLEDELIDLAASVMTWRHIRHVPVEDASRRLVGLVSHRALLRLVARGEAERESPIAVHEVMTREVVSVRPETPTLEAIELMRRRRVSCLPVVDDEDHLVGILSERDLMGIAGHLLEAFLGEGVEAPGAEGGGGQA